MKRLCIKSLPPVLCIQLKRFDYDWELNRAIKFDDYFKVCLFVTCVAFLVSFCDCISDSYTLEESKIINSIFNTVQLYGRCCSFVALFLSAAKC